MYNDLRNGIISIFAAYCISCSSNPSPRDSNDANDDVQETVHVTHEEETVVTTRTETVQEHSTETRNGNQTTVDSRTTTQSRESRLRTVNRTEGDRASAPRNVTFDLESMVSGISSGSFVRGVENENVYFEISFSLNGTRLSASLVDFTDEMIGGEGDKVFDYFVFGIERGRNLGYFMRVNFSNNESMDYRQEPHTASLARNVSVGNVVYRVGFRGGHDSNGDLTNDDIMRLVDAAREKLSQDGYQ